MGKPGSVLALFMDFSGGLGITVMGYAGVSLLIPGKLTIAGIESRLQQARFARVQHEPWLPRYAPGSFCKGK